MQRGPSLIVSGGAPGWASLSPGNHPTTASLRLIRKSADERVVAMITAGDCDNILVVVNASASEELAATAEEMSAQAEQLQQSMAFFRLGGQGPASTPPKRGKVAAARPARAPGARGWRSDAAPAYAMSEGPDEGQFARF